MSTGARPGALVSSNVVVEQNREQALPEETVPEIDRAILTGIHKETYSAAACVASVGGRIFHRGVYGSLSRPPPLCRLGFDTLFDLASLTKPLGSGLALLELTSKNRIDLHATLNRTIPELRQNDELEAVTIDMLLDHTAGLPSFRSYWEDLRNEEKGNHPSRSLGGTSKAAGWLRKRVAQTALEYEPGSQVVYSDIGFMLLGWIVEDLVGKPLDGYLARGVYRELGVADDLFFIRLDDQRQMQRLRRRAFAATEQCVWRGKLLQGEVHDPNAWILGGVAGHAGLFGTIDAVWRVAHALWASFKGESRAFLGGTVRRFWTRSKRPLGTTRTLAWDTPSAQGSSSGTRFSKTSVGHTGFTGTSIWIDPTRDLIGILLTNAAHPSPQGKKEQMAKLRPRVYDLIAKHGEALSDRARGSRATAVHSPVATGAGRPLDSALRGPGKPV